ncbi:hypothetical protein DFH28DRAFT_1004479 [Melampsora americana]|nr:hypothetical protein DFH28DRAFT_1004479 [Melampsora americana]
MSRAWLHEPPIPQLDQLALSPTSSHTLSALANQPSKPSNARFNSHPSLGSPSTTEQSILLSQEMIMGARSDQCCSNTPNSQQLIHPWPNSFGNEPGLYDRNHDDHRKRKRNRTMQSCLPCHTNKRKCDRGRPCRRCLGLGTTGLCVYETEDPKLLENLDTNDPAWEVIRLRERVAELEGVVRCLKGRPNPKQRSTGGSGPRDQTSNLGSSSGSLTSPTFARPHSQSVSGVTWSPTTTENSTILDIVQGRCRVNSSSNGSQPNSPSCEPITQHPQPLRGTNLFKGELESINSDSDRGGNYHYSLMNAPILRPASCPPCMTELGNVIQDDDDSDNGQKVFLGSVSTGSLIRKLQGITSPSQLNRNLSAQPHANREKTGLITTKVAYMGLFGGEIGRKWAFDLPGSNEPKGIVDFLRNLLPCPDYSQELLGIFLQEVDCLYHGWHTPTLTGYYHQFFHLSESEQHGFPMHKLSVISAIITVTICLTRRIFGDEHDPHRESTAMYRNRLKHWQSHNSRLLASLTVDCLKKASYLGHPSLECIQAQIILSLYMVNNGRCTDAWCFIGGFIKQAQCLGLHIDPKKLDPNQTTLDQEVKRRIWWAIQTWDISLSIAFGWPAGVTLNDTDMPQDRDEESLSDPEARPEAPELPPNGVTDMSYHVYNWEACQYAHHMMDKIFRQARWRWHRQGSTDGAPREEDVKYTDVIELDKAIRAWYKAIPADMRFEPEPLSFDTTQTGGQLPDPNVFYPSSSGVGVKDIKKRNPKWAKQALMLAISHNTILLLLHRPFIGESSQGSSNLSLKDYQLSSRVRCLRSSQVIIEAQRLLVQLFPTTHRMWYGWYKTFHAAMTSAWISLLQSDKGPIFQIGARCVEMAIEAFEMVVVDVDANSVQNDHNQACSQLKAIQKFISRGSGSKNLIYPLESMGVTGTNGGIVNYTPVSKGEWVLPADCYPFARALYTEETISPAPFRVGHPAIPGHMYHPPPFMSSLSPQDPSSHRINPSPSSAQCESSGRVTQDDKSRNPSMKMEVFDHGQTSHTSASLPRGMAFDQSDQQQIYHSQANQSSKDQQPHSSAQNDNIHSTESHTNHHIHQSVPLLNSPRFSHAPSVRNFLPVHVGHGMNGMYPASNSLLYAPTHAFGSPHYPDIRGHMSEPMMPNMAFQIDCGPNGNRVNENGESNNSNRYNYPTSSDTNGVDMNRVSTTDTPLTCSINSISW